MLWLLEQKVTKHKLSHFTNQPMIDSTGMSFSLNSHNIGYIQLNVQSTVKYKNDLLSMN